MKATWMRGIAATIFCVTTALAWGNPIIIDHKARDVIKSFERLSVTVHRDFADFHGQFRYAPIPNFVKERENDYKPTYFRMIVPVYSVVGTSPTGDGRDSGGVSVIADGVEIAVTEMHDFTNDDVKQLMRRPGTTHRNLREWIIPRGYKMTYHEAHIPEAVLDGGLIEVRYSQPHVRYKRRQYVLYTPVFENPEVWKAVMRNPGDYQAEFSTDTGLDLAFDQLKVAYHGVRGGKHIVFLDHFEHIWAEVRKQGASES